MIRATFVMEQHLGHATFCQNLRRYVDACPLLSPRWVEVAYGPGDALQRRLPAPAAYARGTLHGLAQVQLGLRARGCQVRYFNTQVPAVLAGAYLRGVPYLIGTDITPAQYDVMAPLYGHQPDRSGPATALKHRLSRATLRGAARLLPWSAWAARSLVEDYGVDPARVEVLPPGVDLGRWSPGAGRPPGPPRILFVGRDLARKGGDLLLEAFRALPPGSAELHLVTRTPVSPEAGVVVHGGLSPNDPELVGLYRRCDIFALPTRAEAFGIAAVEASAAGLPVVASDFGGLRDIVADGETGFLVPPGDPAALAGRLGLLLADQALRERMGRAARARAEARFDARRNAARLIACLQEAAGARGRRPYARSA